MTEMQLIFPAKKSSFPLHRFFVLPGFFVLLHPRRSWFWKSPVMLEDLVACGRRVSDLSTGWFACFALAASPNDRNVKGGSSAKLPCPESLDFHLKFPYLIPRRADLLNPSSFALGFCPPAPLLAGASWRVLSLPAPQTATLGLHAPWIISSTIC